MQPSIMRDAAETIVPTVTYHEECQNAVKNG